MMLPTRELVCPDETRWGFDPWISLACHLVSEFIKFAHVYRIERFARLFSKLGRDVCQIEVVAITFTQGKLPKVIDHTAQHLLLEYSWPGNIRELENTIKYALAMGRGKSITKHDMPVQILIDQKPAKSEGSQSTKVETLTNQSIKER